jgi:hypothetical protein
MPKVARAGPRISIAFRHAADAMAYGGASRTTVARTGGA